MNVELSAEQQQVVLKVIKEIKNGKQIQRISGFAGTGKSVIAGFFRDVLGYSVCAFTGKATNVLRRRGIPASTIHGLIYEVLEDNKKQVIFRRREELPCSGVIIDEASMVGRDIYNDLTEYKKPLIFIGDHGQLEPVASEDFNIMRDPDYKLEKIHRNAGEISRFAEWLREGKKAHNFRGKEGKVEFLTKSSVDERGLWTEVDQIICAYNKTRVMVNDMIREKLGYRGKLVCGDKIICLRNDRQKMVFNGMQGIVTEISRSRGRNLLSFVSYDENFYDIPYLPSQFGLETTLPKESKDDPIPFDYGNCITAHKAIGDEWDKVLVLDQYCKNWEMKRWYYTVASRAKEKLFWVFGF